MHLNRDSIKVSGISIYQKLKEEDRRKHQDSGEKAPYELKDWRMRIHTSAYDEESLISV